MTIAVILFVCFLGIASWLDLDIEAYPDISDIEVTIITQVNGLPSEEIEQQITVPIERALNTVPGVISKRSRSIFGLSIVRLTFDDNTNIYLARQLVLEKLRDAELPANAKPQLGAMTSSIGEIFRYVVEGTDNIPLTTLREIQEYIIIPKLLQAAGVVDVANFGGLIRQYQVVMNPIELEKYNLTIHHIASAIQDNNKNTGGNFINIGTSQMNIRGVGRISKLEDIENIVVENRNGVPILIKDVANVELGHQQPSGVLGYIDKNRNKIGDTGIEGIILLRKFENPSKTMLSVYEKVKEVNKDLEPIGIKVVPFYDRTELVGLTIKTVVETLAEGTIVVFIVLTLLLGSWRAAIISCLAIPFSLLFAFICMKYSGIPANLLSLGAIDFGIIVDAAIVMVESIFRYISISSEEEKKNDFHGLIVKSASSVYKQIFFAIGIIILALFPILSLQRVEGRMFSPMAWTLSFAIFGSLVYSLTVVPILSFYMFQNMKVKHDIFVWTLVQNFYDKYLSFFIARPLKTLYVFSGIVLFLISLTKFIGTEFLPELDEGSIWIKVFLPAGISLKEAMQYPEQVKLELSKYDEVRGVLTQLGRNDDGTDPYSSNRFEVLVQLKQPYKDWTTKRSKKELVLDIKRKLSLMLPGVSFNISQPIIDTTTENATGSSADLAIFINGKNLDELRNIAQNILHIVKDTEGSSESSIEQEDKQTQLVVSIDRQACARYGINVENINEILETAIGGLPVSDLYENERKFDIIIRFTIESRNTPSSIGKILVTSNSGQKIPLSQVANIHLEEGQSIIFRENGKRQITVKTNIRGKDQGSFAKEINKKIKSKIQFPTDVSYYIGGQFENMERSQKRLAYIVPLTLVLIYLTLLIFFNNQYIYALITMANIPVAIAGGVLALLLRGMNFSISAGVGFVSLFGISVMSGVLLISYLNERRELEPEISLFDIVIQGSILQFKPRFLVMMIAIIGLFPAAFNTGIGSDVQRPLATVIVGGLTLSLCISIFISPVLYYYIINRRIQKE